MMLSRVHHCCAAAAKLCIAQVSSGKELVSTKMRQGCCGEKTLSGRWAVAVALDAALRLWCGVAL